MRERGGIPLKSCFKALGILTLKYSNHMEKFEKYLFYYCLIASSLIFVGSTFFSPTPHNYFLMALFLPITLFFWLRISLSGKEVSQNTQKATLRWSGRLLVVVFLLILSGIFAQFLSTKAKNDTNAKITLGEEDKKILAELKEKLEQKEKEQSSLVSELNEIKARLTELSYSEGLDSVLGTLDSDYNTSTQEAEAREILGYVTINNSTKSTIDVHKEPSLSSKVVGQIKNGVNYPFFENSGSWYLIKDGWVKADFMKEVSDSSQ